MKILVHKHKLTQKIYLCINGASQYNSFAYSYYYYLSWLPHTKNQLKLFWKKNVENMKKKFFLLSFQLNVDK